MDVRIIKTPLSYYAERLKTNNTFTFVRYGNGEWDGILGTRRETGSGSQRLNIPGLRQGLKLSLKRGFDPDYYLVGMQNHMQKRVTLWRKTKGWLQINAPNLVWHDADVFHHCSSRSQMWPLIKELRKKPLVFVGPSHIRPISKQLPYVGFVEVRRKDCYQDIAKIRKAILGQKRPAVFCFSAGPTAKILMSELFPVLGKENFLIDFGSVWDIYCGVRSRSYHKRITLAIVRKNFGG